jgi:hypothetical protein
MHGVGSIRLMLSRKQEANPFRQEDVAFFPIPVGGVWYASSCPRTTLEAGRCASAEASSAEALSRQVVEDPQRLVESAFGPPFRHERTVSGTSFHPGKCASGVPIRPGGSVTEPPALPATAPTSSQMASTSSAADRPRHALPLPALFAGPPLSSVGRASFCSLARRPETWRCCRPGRSRIGRGRSAVVGAGGDGPLAGQRFPRAGVGASWVFRGPDSMWERVAAPAGVVVYILSPDTLRIFR